MSSLSPPARKLETDPAICLSSTRRTTKVATSGDPSPRPDPAGIAAHARNLPQFFCSAPRRSRCADVCCPCRRPAVLCPPEGAMLTAVMTDIHANREAFSACLADAAVRGVTGFVLLGDYVGYGAEPG